MKYRSAYRNGEPTWPNKIRALSKDQLLQCLDGEKYLKRMLQRLGVPTQAYLGDILRKAFEDHGIDISHLPIGRRENLTGQTFGHLQVLRIGPTLKCGNTTWICREAETGIEKPVLSKHLKSGASKSFSFFFQKGESHVQWSGCGQISGSRWSGIRKQAIERKLVFEITIEQAWELYLKQERKCALSGVSIYFGESNTCPYTASLDRVDNTKGYTLDNIQWVHTRINIMKNKFSQDEFLGFCRAVAATHPLPIK